MSVNKIRKLRIDKKLKMKELAKMAKISISYLSLLEKGKRVNPSKKIMENISKALEVDIIDIFFEE